MEIWLSKRDDTTLCVKFLVFYRDGVSLIKTIPRRRWIPEESAWVVPYTLEVIEQVLIVFASCKIHVEPVLLEECYVLQDWYDCLAVPDKCIVSGPDGL